MHGLIIRHGNVSDDQRDFFLSLNSIADSFIMHYSLLSALLLWSLSALHLLRLLFFRKKLICGLLKVY
jgi:hypothetical protein